jgi:hypothetical protein
MKTDFIQELIENEDVPRLLESLSGWEAVFFVLEDEPSECGGSPPPSNRD